MSHRARELAARRATLRLRCAVQRRAIASEVESVEQRLATVDRVARAARAFVSHPAVVAVSVLGTIVLARTRSVRVLRNAVVLVGGVRRLVTLLVRQ